MQFVDRVIDMSAIAANFIQGGARECSPEGSMRVWAQLLVVGIEQKAEPAIEAGIAGQMREENEFLKEPCRMGQVPFRRTGVGHGLDHLVLRPQGVDKFAGLAAHLIVSVEPLICLYIDLQRLGYAAKSVWHGFDPMLPARSLIDK